MLCGVLFLSNYQMYVPGKLKNTDKVMVDIGTGYYAEKVESRYMEHSYSEILVQATLLIVDTMPSASSSVHYWGSCTRITLLCVGDNAG